MLPVELSDLPPELLQHILYLLHADTQSEEVDTLPTEPHSSSSSHAWAHNAAVLGSCRLVCRQWHDFIASSLTALAPAPPAQDRDLFCLRNFPRLAQLSVRSGGLTAHGLASLWELQHLRQLDVHLFRCGGGMDEAALLTLQPLTALRTLNVGLAQVTPGAATALQALTQVARLGVACSAVFGEAHVLLLGRLAPRLTSADFSGSSITDDGLRALARLTGLEQLRLEGCHELSRYGLPFLLALTRLASLSLRSSSGLSTDDVLAVAGRLTRLAHIDVHGCWFGMCSDEGLGHLADLSRLTSLAFGGSRCDVTDVGCGRLAALKSLQRLEIDCTHGVTDAGMFILAGALTGLTSLDMSNLDDISATAMAALARLTALSRLSIFNWKRIAQAGFGVLRHLPRLRHLDIHEVRFSDEGMLYLRHASRIEFLALRACWGVTDAGLSHLAHLLGLHTLTLDGCNISDAGLAAALRPLAGSLRHLTVRNCYKVSAEVLPGLGCMRRLGHMSFRYCHASLDGISLEAARRLAGLQQLQHFEAQPSKSRLVRHASWGELGDAARLGSSF